MPKFTVKFKDGEELVLISTDKIHLSDMLSKRADKDGFTREDIATISSVKRTFYDADINQSPVKINKKL